MHNTQSEVKIYHTKAMLVIALLVILIIWGFSLRIWNLGEQSLWIDEGYSINAANGILEHGYPLLDSGLIYKSSHLSTYGIAGTMALFNFTPENPWSARILSVFFGVFIIGIIYLFSGYLFKNYTGALLAATIVTLSSWEIDWSRQARGYIELQFFIFLSLFFFWRWLRDKRTSYLFVSLGAFLLAYLAHPLAIIFAPVFPIAYVAHTIRNQHKKVSWKPIILGGIALLTFIIIFALPKFLSTGTYDYSPLYVSFIKENLGVVGWTTLFGIIIGIFDKKRFGSVAFISVTLLFPLLIIMFYGPVVQMRFLFPLFPLFVILSIYAVFRTLELLPLLHKHIKTALLVPIVFLLFTGQLTFIPQTFYQSEYDSPRPDFKSAYTLIKKNKTGTSVILSPYAHLTKIYLEETGMWLPISLTGRKSELEKTIIDGKYDFYVNAPIVADTPHLQQILDNEHGYIIIDGMARTRLDEWVSIIEEHPKITTTFQSGDIRLNKIWVYEF